MIATDSLHQHPDSPPAQSAELRILVDRARRGELDALPRLRVLLDDHPEIWRSFGDLARHAQNAWIKLAGGSDLALVEALRRKIAEMKNELAGPEPAPLEKLLIERIVVTWLQVHYADSIAAQSPEVPLRQAEFLLRRQAQAQKRYLAALGALLTTRRLLARVDPPAPAPVPRPETGRREAPPVPVLAGPPTERDPGTTNAEVALIPYQSPTPDSGRLGPRRRRPKARS